MTVLRVLSYNIHKGFTVGGTRYVLKQIREAIRTVPVDILFLQEVIGNHDVHARNIDDWPKESQFEYLADSVWPYYAYGKNAIYSESHHGNAILSKFPIDSYLNIDISNNRFEQRGILFAKIQIPESDIVMHCVNVHLDLSHTGRIRQVKKLCAYINTEIPREHPLILAGDFNDWPKRLSQTIESEIQAREVFRSIHGNYASTFPSKYPFLKLDRIYSRGLATHKAVQLCGTPWNNLSDHTPLYSEFNL